MMVFISIVFIISIVVTIIVYIKKTPAKERLGFNPLSTLMQTVFVFVTLWITIYTIRSSNADSEQLFNNLNSFNTQFSEMESSLKGVSTKLKEMPTQIDKFSNSIDSLNTSVKTQNQDFKLNTQKLNTTINSLSKSVKDYERNINNYSAQLESIVKLTNQQLDIWKEQQRIMLNEYSRRPNLLLEPKLFLTKKDTIFVNDLIIRNIGNIEASPRSIFINIPEEIFIDIQSEYFKKLRVEKNKIVYRFYPEGTNVASVSAGARIIIPCSLKLRNNKINSIEYQIIYNSDYDSGNKTGSFTIK